MAGCMGFVWVHAGSFLHSVASTFYSVVTNPTAQGEGMSYAGVEDERWRGASRGQGKVRGLEEEARKGS